MELTVSETEMVGSFLFGKHREAQRFLYNVRPRSTGVKEKENEL